MKKPVSIYGKESYLNPTFNATRSKQNKRSANNLLNSFVIQFLKAGLMVLAFCLLGTTQVNAQTYDLNLTQSVDKDSVGIGETVTFTLTVTHESGDAATGIIVTDSLPSGLTNIVIGSSDGTASYDMSTGKIIWNVEDINDAKTSSNLTFMAEVIAEGIHFNVAEITTSPGDSDSNAGNNNYLEDDIAASCVSVPIKMCTALQDTVLVSAPVGATNVQWYRVYDFGGDGAIGAGDTMALAAGNNAEIDSAGTYFFTADLGSCQTGNCCPLMIEPACMDLALIKTLTTTGTVSPGDTVEFLVKVYNQGDINTDSILLSDYLPGDLNLVEENGWTLVGSGNDTTGTKLLTIAGGEIAAGGLTPMDSVSTTVRAVVDAGFTGTSLVNYAEISNQTDIYGNDLSDSDSQDDTNRVGDGGGVPESNTDNVVDNSNGDEDDHDPALVTVTQEFDLALTKVVSEAGPYALGDTITFTIKVYNQGTVEATGVEVTEYVPTGMVMADPDWTSAVYSLGAIAAGDSAMVDVDLQILPSFAGTTLTNNAEITAGTNALGLVDEDGDIATVDGSMDAVTELATDNDVDDEAPGTPGTADNGSDVDDWDLAQISIVQEFDLALTKVVSEAGPYALGDTITFTIKVYNQGTLEATGVEVTEYVPTGMVMADPDWTSAVYSLGAIAAGDSAMVDVDLQILPSFAGTTLTNNAEITAGTNALGLLDEDGDIATVDGSMDAVTELATDNDVDDEAPGTPGTADNGSDVDDWDLAQISIVQEFDLALTKVVSEAGPYALGDTITYTIKVYNQGTVEATGVEVTEYVPTGMVMADPDWTSAVYSLGAIAAGDSAMVDVDLQILPSFAGTTLTNNAEITAGTNALGLVDEDGDIATVDGSMDAVTELATDNDVDDEAPGTPGTADNGSDVDDWDLAQISIVQEFDLALTKVVSEAGPYALGDTITYTIKVYNQGTVEATGVEVTEYVPTGMVMADPDWTSAVYSLGAIAAGDSAMVDVDLQILPSFAGTTLTNNAEITAGTNALGLVDEDGDIATVDGSMDAVTELATDNDVDDEAPGTPGTADNGSDVDDWDLAQISIVQEFDLALTKVVSEAGPYALGDTITYTIKVYNQGTVEATGVEVTEYVPTGMVMADPDWTSAVYSLGAIAAGDSAMVDVDLQILPSFAGTTLTNNAEITAGTNALGLLDEDGDIATVDGSMDAVTELATDNDVDDEAPGTPGTADNGSDVDDWDLAQISLVQEFDLALTKVVSEAGPYALGDTITYTIKVYNQGTVEATGVEVTEYVPTGMVMADPDWTSAVYSLGAIAAGDSAMVDVDLQILPSFAGTTLTNNAEITAGTNALGLVDEDGDIATVDGSMDAVTELATDNDVDDEAPGTPGTADNGSDVDDWDLAQISIVQEFDLALTKVVSEAGPYALGDTITYTIKVYNQGTVEATGVEVTEYVPTGMVMADPDWTSAVYSLGAIAAGDSAMVDVDLQILPSFAGTTLTNNAEITAGTNALGLLDEDGDIATVDGSMDAVTELATDNDVDDEAPGTPGTADNGSDVDDWDLAQISIVQEFDLALTKVVSEAGPYALGDTITYTIKVYNQGTVEATGVEVTEYVPTGMVMADPDWTSAVYSLGAIAAGDSAMVDVDLQILPSFAGTTLTNNAEITAGTNALGLVDEDGDIATVDGSMDAVTELATDNDVDDEAPGTPGTADNGSDVDDWDLAQISLVQEFDLALTKVVSEAGPYALGDTITYTIKVYNQGTVEATGVEVTEYVPTGMVMADPDWTSAVYSLGAIAAGDSAMVDVDLQILPSFAGTTLTNNAEITAGTNALGLVDEDGDIATVDGSMDAVTELATDNDVDDEAPGTPGTADNGSDVDDWDLAQISLVQEFDLALTKVVSEAGPYALGDTITYTIKVYNQGTVEATGVEVTEYVPTGMVMADPDWTSAVYSLGAIAAGDSAMVDVDLQILPSFAGTTLTNNAEITAGTNALGLVDEDGDIATVDGSMDAVTELATDNDVDDEAPGTPGTADNGSDVDDWDLAQISIVQEFDLALTKVVSEAGPYALGDTITYTIKVYNQGTVEATGVEVTEYVPTGMVMADPDWTSAVYSLGAIAAGDSAMVDVDLQILPSFAGTTLTNNAEITAGTNALGLVDEDGDIATVDGSMDAVTELATDNDVDDEAPGTPGTADNGSDVDDWDLAQISLVQEFDLALTKVVSEAGPYALGDTITYTIKVYNQGTVEATGVEVTEYVPTGMVMADPDWTSAVYSLGAIAAGDSAMVDVDLQILPSFAGTTLTNNAEITAGTNALGLVDEDGDIATVDGSMDAVTELATDNDVDDEAPGTPGTADNGSDVDDWDLAQISIVQEFDLALTKVVSEAGPYALGDTITYTIKVYNQGTVEATGVEVTEYVPTGMVMADPDWTSAVYSLGAIAAGDSAMVDVDLQILPSFAGTTLTNNAEITAGTNALGLLDEDGDIATVDGSMDAVTELATDNDVDDEAPGTPGTADNGSDVDDWDLAQISIVQEFDLALTKVVSEAGPYALGDTITYTIKVYNQGTVEATGVEVTEYVPTGMVMADPDWTSAVYSLGAIAAGDSAMVDVDLQILPSFAGTTLTNNAEITAGTNALGLVDEDGDIATVDGSMDAVTELATDNDVDDEAPGTPGTADNGSDVDDWDLAQISIVQEFDLALTKVVSEAGPYALGDTITYTIKVYNQGTVEATGVEVTEYVPTGMVMADPDWTSAVYSLGAIAAGDSAMVDVDLQILPSFAGTTLTNNAEITAGTNALGLVDEDGDIATVDGSMDAVTELATDNDVDDEAPGTPGTADNGSDVDDWDLAQISLVQEFDLALTKVVSEAGPYALGDTITYTIKVYNQGTVEATGVEVTEYVPTGMVMADPDWTSAVYSLGAIAAGDSAMVDVDLQILPSFAGTTLTNNAEITAGTNALGLVDEDGDIATVDGSMDAVTELATDNDVDDEAPGTPGTADNGSDVDDWDLAQISIVQEFDLALTKVVSEAGPYALGDTITYTIKVYNQGTVEATGVEVTEYVPTGMVMADPDWTSAVYSLGAIAAGDSAMVDVDLQILPSFAGTTLTNNAEITAGTNALGLVDEDGDIATVDGSMDAVTELATDNDVDDEAPGTPGTADNGSDVDDWDLAQISIVQEFDLALTKVVSEAGPYALGDTITYTIKVYNQGTVEATGVEVTEYVPTGMVMADPDWTSAVYSLGAIAAGDSAMVDVDLQILPSFAGTTLTNNAEITAGTNALGLVDEDGDIATVDGSMDAVTELATDNDVDDEAPGTPGAADNGSDVDDWDLAQISLVQVYDLALTKVLAESGSFAAGDTVTFRIYVHNQGTLEAAAGTVEVTDYVPSDMTMVDADWTGNTYTFPSAIAAGGMDSVDVDLRIDPSFMGTTITNNAEITADGGDDSDSAPGDNAGDGPDTANDDGTNDGNNDPNTQDPNDDDFDPATVTVGQVYDLALTKVLAESGSFAAGDTVTFRIYVHNQGTLEAAAGTVEVTDYVPSDMTMVDADWTGNTYTFPSAIAAGGMDSVDVDLRIDPSFMGTTITNNAEITADGGDDSDSAPGDNAGDGPDTANDDGTNDGNNDPNTQDPNDDDFDPATVTVGQVYDLALTKVLAESGSFAAGDTVTFRIYVHNQGTLEAAAGTVEVTDYVPSDMTMVDADWTGNTYTFPSAIAAGGMDSVDVDLRIDPSFMGTTITNNAEITADGGDDSDSAPGDNAGDGPDTANDDGTNDGNNDPNTQDPNDDDFDPATVTVGQVYDLALTKVLAESGSFAAGDTVTFRIYVHNQGTLEAAAGTVEVTDYVPSDMTMVDADWTGNTYTFPSAIAAGGMDSVDVDLRIDPSFMGTTITNNAEITADGGDDSDSAPGDNAGDGPDTANDDGTNDGNNDPNTQDPNDDDFDPATVTVGQTFDLALRKVLATGQSANVSPGDTVNYEVWIYNQGTLEAHNINIIDYTPTDMTLVTGNGFSQNWIDNTTNAALFYAGPLAAGNSTSFTISYKIADNFMGNSITNSAEISSADNDTDGTNPNPVDQDSNPNALNDETNITDNEITGDGNNGGDEDDHDIEIVSVAQTFDLALIETLAPGQSGTVAPGELVDLKIKVTNQGSINADTIEITQYLPAGVTLNAANAQGWTALNDSTVQILLTAGNGLPVGGLAQDSMVMLEIEVLIDANATATGFVFHAEISDDGQNTDIDSTPDDDRGNDTGGDVNTATDDIIDQVPPTDEDDEDPTSVVVEQAFDLALTITPAPGQTTSISPGDEVETKVTVFNQGGAPADTIEITAVLPAGTALSTANPNGWTQINDSTVVILLVGADLPNGELAGDDMHMIPLFLVVDDSVMVTSLTVLAEISNDGVNNDDADSTPNNDLTDDIIGGDDVTNNTANDEDDHDPVTFTLTQTFDLALAKRLADGQLSGVLPGDSIEYTITVYNQGSLDAYDVDVVDYIPTDMSLVPIQGWSTLTATTAGQTIPFIPAQDSASLNITLQLSATFAGTSVTNNAEIAEAATSTGGSAVGDDDSTPDNVFGNDGTQINNAIDNPLDEDDADFETIEVGVFDLALDKRLAANQLSTVSIGDDIDYEICVENQGTVDAYNVLVADRIPSGLTLSNNDINNWTALDATTVTKVIPGPIAPGQSVCLSIKLNLSNGIPGADFVNVAEIAGQEDAQGNNIKDSDSTPDLPEEDEEFEEDDINAAIINLFSCPEVTVGTTEENICQGESVPLSVVATSSLPITYSWAPSTGLSDPFIANPVASPYVTTTYVVTTNIGDGTCIQLDTVTVNVFDVPNPDFHANVSCVGQPTVFDDETVTYTTLTDWSWDFGDGVGTSTAQNPSYTYQNPGHYLVKLIVTSTNGCRDSAWQDITVNPGVEAIAKARQDTICEGECVELIAQGGTTFAWSPAATLNHTDCFNPIACPTETTTYYVDITNDFGCPARDSVTVTVVPGPTVAVEMTDISECGQRDGSITVTATGLASSYEYSINGGLTFQSSNVFTNLPASSYLVVVRGGGCEVPYENNPAIVGGAQSPAITAVPAVHPSCTANDGTITIEASGGNNLGYSINGGISWVNSNEFTELAEGIYYIAVASEDRSCITYYPPVTLIQPEAPVFTDVRFTNPTDCGESNGSVTIIASGNDAIEYGLDDGLMTIWQSSNNFINVPAGTYDVYIRNAGNTCLTAYALNSIQLEDPAAPALNAVVVTQPADCGADNATINITATAGSTALEYSIDGGINWNNYAYYENLKPGIYNVIVRNQGGTCEVAYTDNPIDISYPDGPTIMEVLHSQSSDCTSQNGQIQITAEGGSDDLVYSIDGGVTWQESSIFENLAGGIYNIRVANQDRSCPAIYPTIELIDAIGGTIDGITVNGGCDDGSGNISIAASSNTPLEYSVDNGSSFQSSNNFFNLPNGSYNIMIRNIDDSCPISYSANPVVIDRSSSTFIDQVETSDPSSCEDTNGAISISAVGGDIVFSIDGGINYQSTGDFDNLAAGIYNVFIKDLSTGCEVAYEFNPLTLVGPSEPVISNVEVTNPTDCDENDATIVISASNDDGLQYSLDGTTWSNGNSFINLYPGLYNVWVRNDSESCAVAYANNPVVVTAPSGPIITECTSTNPTDCGVNDGTLTILAVGGQGALQYSVDGGTTWQTSNEFTGLGEGTYSVTVANEDETCRAIYPACHLTSPALPVVNDVRAVNPSICGEDNGSITILADGNGALEYSIDNGTTWSANSFFSNLPAATYNVQVRNATDNCIVDHGAVTLDAPAAPSIIAGIENISTCTGNAMPVSITMSEAITEYTIVGSGGYLDANVSGATLTFDAYLNGVVNNFTVTLENADGCTVSHEFAIFQAADPDADFIVHNPTCAETDVTIEFTGNASPGAILTWDLGGATIVSTSAATTTAPAGANLVVQWPTAGGKTISLTINDGGCEDRKVQNVNVNKLPFADAGPDLVICDGECVQLQGAGNGAQYLWSPAAGLSATNIPNPMACPTTTTTYQLLVMGSDGCMVMDEVTVSVTGDLTASAGPDQTICAGNGAQLAATGGTTYSWSPSVGLSNANIANPIATPSVTTTYTVEISNGAGCVGTDAVVVSVGTGLAVNAGANSNICVGENTMLSASGAVNYQWSPATGLSATNIPNPIASPSTTTTYTVVGTDASGCSSTDQVTVLVGGNAQANAGPDASICGSASTQLNASGGVIYSWNPTVGLNNPNIANPIANPSTTTVYTVTVTNQEGCIGTDQAIVSVSQGPNVVGCPDKYICTGGSVRLTVNGGSSWVWSPSTGLDNPFSPAPNASPSVTTTYTVTGTDAFGCSTSDEVVVFVNNGSSVNAGVNQTICRGSQTQLNATGGATYNWSPATGLSNANIANPVANPTVTTTYTVTTSSADGCSGSDQVTVYVTSGTEVVGCEDKTICQGQSVQLNVTTGVTYLYTPSTGLSDPTSPTPIASPTSTTTYTVYVTDANGCTGSDNITVFVSGEASVNAGPDQTVCPGNTAQLNATGGTSYSWTPTTGLSNPNIANPTVTPTATTTYTVNVTNGSGCTGSDQVTVSVGNGGTGANAGPDMTVCEGGSVQLNATGGTSYSWVPTTGLSNPNIANPIATPSNSMTYSVYVTGAGGCSNRDDVVVYVTTGGVSINAGADQGLCAAGGSVQLNATGGSTYSWSPATGLSNTNIANPTANPSTTTTYTVTSTNASGCSGTDQVTVTVGSGLSVTPAITASTCCDNDGRIYLPVIGSTGTLVYNWSPNVTTGNTGNNLSAGVYRVTVTDSQTGCQLTTEATVPNTCNTCVAIAPEPEVCVNQGETVGQLCLPIRLEDIHNYVISTPSQVITPNHGCNFENLTAYSYSLLQGGGNSGPYKIDNWTVNGTSYTGMVNNMVELAAWMNMNDPSGNWSNNSSSLVIMGGGTTTTYGDMKITHLATWIESTLNPNTTGVATGTQVDVPMGTAESVVVTIKNIRTCCEETVLMKRCNTTPTPTRCLEEIVTATQESVTISDCNTTGTICVDIPLQEILNYEITADGVDYAGGFRGCNFDTLYAYTYFTIPNQGNSGPYRLRSWTIDGQTYSGDFDNLSELLTLMNAWDRVGNWSQDASTLTLQGGIPAKKYGTMDIEQINTGAFAILELNSNLLPLGTQLAFAQGTHNVIFTNKATGCEDDLLAIVTCDENKAECQDFIASNSESITVMSCTDLAAFCVEIPSSDLGIYAIELNGSVYTGEVNNCESNDGSIQLYAAEGRNTFTFTNQLTDCRDEIVVKVTCLQTGDNKVPTTSTLGKAGPITSDAGKLSAMPQASGDETVTSMNQSARISVTANDRAVKENTTLTIIESPAHGRLTINADNTITYEPTEGYCHSEKVDFFKYEICNDEGCDEAQVKVIVECEPIKVFSAFSPNNDGVNEYFKVEGLEAYPENELRIYNRFGKLLYEQSDYQNDWNGESAGEQLPDGTYYYIINDGKGKQHSGYIQINR